MMMSHVRRTPLRLFGAFALLCICSARLNAETSESSRAAALTAGDLLDLASGPDFVVQAIPRSPAAGDLFDDGHEVIHTDLSKGRKSVLFRTGPQTSEVPSTRVRLLAHACDEHRLWVVIQILAPLPRNDGVEGPRYAKIDNLLCFLLRDGSQTMCGFPMDFAYVDQPPDLGEDPYRGPIAVDLQGRRSGIPGHEVTWDGSTVAFDELDRIVLWSAPNERFERVQRVLDNRTPLTWRFDEEDRAIEVCEK